MVNHGASQGCITCRKRHVKCDETKPACVACIRLRRRCEGYGRHGIRVRFKDESSRYLNWPPKDRKNAKSAKHEKPEKTRRCTCDNRHICGPRNHVVIPSNPQCKQLDIALTFFLKYVTDVGRSLESTRGFLEFVRPVLAADTHGSALSAAVSAAAVKFWALLTPSDVAASLLVHLHNQALVKLQQAIKSPIERKKQATVFAALMLQYHATLTAIFDHHEARSTHRFGALALLTQKDHRVGSFQHRGHLLGNCFHSKISSCVRHKVSLDRSEVQWLRIEVMPGLVSNPSTRLDIIGMSISKLQNALGESLSSQEDVVLGALQELPAIICDVDAQLQAWSDTVPKSWHPGQCRRESGTPSSLITYHDSYDIYLSLQIANIWNTWRMYRLIVEHARLAFIRKSLISSGGGVWALPTDQILFDGKVAQYLQEIEDLTDSVCRSIPFYLGNCCQPISFSDIDGPQLFFPSYHDLPRTEEASITYKRSNHYVSKTDHNRHVALHGPLHALSVLSSLVDLFSEERYSTSARGVLHRQKQWINQQLHRSLHLTRLVSPTSDCTGESYQPKFPDHVRQVLSTVTVL